MPELPEVETVRRALERYLVGRTVCGVQLARRDIVVTPDHVAGRGGDSRPPRRRAVSAAELLAGSTIESVRRHGKQLALIGRTGEHVRVLVIHLGMTGTVACAPAGGSVKRENHVHATWELDNGTVVRFRDPRRFGGIWVLPGLDDLERRWSDLGPDALKVTPAHLRRALAGSRRPIKSALLDQRVLAGVGNIYADESLFLARIHPRRLALRIEPGELASLAKAIRRVLAASVAAGGSTVRDYLSPDREKGWYQTKHRVYGRAGLPCSRCGNKLKQAIFAQRTTVWCAKCQLISSTRGSRSDGELSTSGPAGCSTSDR